MILADSMISELRTLSHELIDARTDAEIAEAVRAYLCTCQTYGIGVDDTGELVPARNP